MSNFILDNALVLTMDTAFTNDPPTLADMEMMRAAYNDMQAIGNEGIKVANTFWFGWHNVEPHTYGLVELCGQKKEPEYQEFKNIASEIIQ